MASNKRNSTQFDCLPWDSVRDYLKETVQSQRVQPTDHWLTLLDQRVAKCNRELNRSNNQTENYMKWIRSRGKNIKASSKSIPSSILGEKNVF